MRFTWLLLLALTAVAFGQNQTSDDEAAFFNANAAAWDLQNGIGQHIMEDGRDFQLTKQQPVDDASLPSLLIRKDGSVFDPATPGQRARLLMEQLRQGIHALLSAEKAEGLDAMALDQARASWPKMRDIFCRDYPSVRYYDLDGTERYCPARSTRPH